MHKGKDDKGRDTDRRAFLLQAGALFTGLVGAAGEAHAAAARTDCGFDKRRKTNLCTVRVMGPLQFFPAGKVGGESGGAWLACLQMVFKFYGHVVPAASILRDVYHGSLPKAPWQDLSAFAQGCKDEKGHHVNITTEKLSVRAADAAELLAENQPLIIGAFGHPVLLTAMSYTGDRLGGMTIVDATVLDPLPGKGTRIVSSPDWVNVTFITRISVRKGGAKT
jgi:hypothetical protein